jgi:hypothetical protein
VQKNYDWVVKSIFLLVLKLQDIDSKSARLLKHGIPHATSNFVFWGFNGWVHMRLLQFVSHSSLKIKMLLG